MVLGFFRLLYVASVLRRTALALLHGIECAVAAFNGVPR